MTQARNPTVGSLEPSDCPNLDAYVARLLTTLADEENASASNALHADSDSQPFGPLVIQDSVDDAIETHLEHCDRCRAHIDAIAHSMDRDHADWLPTPIPGYEYRQVLGRGGHSLVVLAWEQSTDRRVALKLVPRTEHGPIERLSRESERSVAAKMEHPNLVRLYSVATTPEWIALVFEYIEGGTLQQLESPLDPRVIASWFARIATGLATIHEHGFLHLDLKPSNILIEKRLGSSPRDWQPKISDFGVARPFHPQGAIEQSSAADAGILPGTLEYMAPEQLFNVHSQLSIRTDVYGLGRVLQFLLSKSPREGIPPDAMPTRDALDRIADRCTHDDPRDRYANVAQAIDDVTPWIVPWFASPQSESRGHYPPHPQSFTTAPPRKSSWLRSLRWVGLTLIVTGAVAALLALQIPWQRVPHPKESPTLETRWIQDLDASPAILTPELEQRLRRQSELRTQDLLSGPGPGSESRRDERLRVALLQRAFGERVASSQQSKFFALAEFHLRNAQQLLGALLTAEPNNDRVRVEWIGTTFALATMPKPLGNDLQSFAGLTGERLELLEATSNQIEALQKPMERTFWKARVLDAFREWKRLAMWLGESAIAGQIELAEQHWNEQFPLDQEVIDLRLRRALSRSESGHEAFHWHEPANTDWNIPEDRELLQREFLVGWMCRIVFAQPIDSTEPGSVSWPEEIDHWLEGAAQCALGVEQLPNVFQVDFVRPFTALSTQLRSLGELHRAEFIQARHVALCEALLHRFPDHPDVLLALSESHLQTWKNALRRGRDDDALAALEQSQHAAAAALHVAPNNPLAKQQVADRIKRIARLQAQKSGNAPAAN
ncbi:MAG: serine/threonine-protein kinase [Pirellula sp.]